MNAQSFFRISGLALVIGSVIRLAAEFVSAFFYGSTTSYANNPINVLTDYVLAAATILILLGLPGVYGSRAHGFGVVGLLGMVSLFAASSLTGVFANLEAAMVDPWLATQAPSFANGFGPPPFFAFFNVEELLLVVGSVLLAIPLLRGRVSPRWPAFGLLLSVVVGIVSFFLFISPSSTLAASFMGTLPSMLLLVALGGLGYQTWSEPSGSAARVTTPAEARTGATSTP
jgi:hypothetical protein